MTYKHTILSLLGAIAVSLSGMAFAGAPNFGPAIWADGQLYGTKGTTALPAPTADNVQSFDVLYAVMNSNNPEGQLAIAEAAPGNPNYNGGRWFTHTVEWTEAGFLAYGFVPVLKSADDVQYQADMGYVVITPGSFPGGPDVYFQCPILPNKG
jgi:hypothetical protein